MPGLALIGRIDTDPKRSWGEDRLDVGLYRAHRRRRAPALVLGLAPLAIAALAVIGSLRLEIESDFTKNFRADSPVVRSYEFVEESLGGAGVWDLLVARARGARRSSFSPCRTVRGPLAARSSRSRIGQASKPGLTKVFSLADVVADGLAGVAGDVGRMPAAVTTTALAPMRSYMPETFRTLHAARSGDGRIRLSRLCFARRSGNPPSRKNSSSPRSSDSAARSFRRAERSARRRSHRLFCAAHAI